MTLRNKLLYTLGFALFVLIWLGVMEARADSFVSGAWLWHLDKGS